MNGKVPAMFLRLLAAALLLAFSPLVWAQADAQSKPPALQPLPEPPPPPPGYEPDPALEPQVTIRKRGEDTVEEYRINGRLYMVKVTPPHGTPYYLVDRQGDGVFDRQDDLGTDVRPPMWVIFSF
ncbi:MAG TPA: DUF2782 domain-containing protein [Burkholderiales bacterium]|nr:DUF2782 domain-containing protein [Burkholderiales bacterium]